MLPRNMLYLRTCYFGKCYLGTCYLGTYYFGACYLGTCYLRTCCLGTCSFMRSLSFGCPQKHNSCHMSQDTVPTSKSKKCPMLFFPKGCHRSSCLFGSLYLKRLATACCMFSKQKTLTPISFKQFCWCFLSRGSLNGY